MEKSAQPGEGGGTPTPFHYFNISTITYKVVVVRSSWEGRYTPPISTLPLYVLCGYDHGRHDYKNSDGKISLI
jgi:hypothetical protein